jgi:glycine dehydrogenase
MTQARSLPAPDPFVDRHIGPRPDEIAEMLSACGQESLETLVEAVIPAAIRRGDALDLGTAGSEHELLEELRRLAGHNQICRSFIGMGYSGCHTPPVIQRGVLENPGWYTQYTPYQAEIAQGRLEALMNFQTMVAELTALPLSSASLLDEATAAAEAMAMCHAIGRRRRKTFFVAESCHPQTIGVVRTRARPLGIEIVVGRPGEAEPLAADLFGTLLQYPTTDGRIEDYGELVGRMREADARVILATDLLALTLLRPPGELGADVAIGSSQRFGVPFGYGGPHAAFLATRSEFERHLPGRIVGVSRDAQGRRAYRLARQTREQHIRREKATSNICTAQVLLAVIAGFYAVYHGPEGLRRIAQRVHGLTSALAAGLRRLGYSLAEGPFFDTLKVDLERGADQEILTAARSRCLNLRHYDDGALGIALDETTTERDLTDLLQVFSRGLAPQPGTAALLTEAGAATLPAAMVRSTPYLEQQVFHAYRSEHEMLRYLHRLQQRDLSLTHSMIPLGSCTMKLNAAAEMKPVTWPQFAGLHPFAPPEQARGYAILFEQLESWLAEITGFAAVSLQPNAGSQGELAGLLVIRAFHESRGEGERDVCLIPTSAHGTNPASAVMAGCRVVAVACDEQGNVDLADLRDKAERHAQRLAALMLTYPSTHGVFEAEVRAICDAVHEHGGQVYMDGANMNAQVGLCRPGDYGADVCHLNLHKTFCIPHGGGGPGVGPICAAAHLAPFLPGHPVVPCGGPAAIGPIAAAPYGSAGILPISWMYIALMGRRGLARASQVAILNANYMAARLRDHYPALYTGAAGLVAHEFIIDLRPFRDSAGVTVDDVAKRLMDFGFHAPTMSWPVAGTMMIEPTESESKAELDRFCDAMVAIRREIEAIADGTLDREDNPLRRAPHTAQDVAADDWDRAYSRRQAAFPLPWVEESKFWPPVARIDNAWGDRHLVCTCDPVESYEESTAATESPGGAG